VAIGAAIGGLLAAGYAVRRPPTYTATALVLLPAGASSSGSQADTVSAITTEARIATSAAVLIPAGRKVDRFLSLPTLQRRVKANAPATASVLTIVATGTSVKET